MKKMICLVMIFCLALSVAAQAETAGRQGTVDTAGWVEHSLGTIGISMMLPPDMAEFEVNAENAAAVFTAQNDHVVVSVIHDPAYEACKTVEDLANTLAESSGEKIEIEKRGSLEMAHMIHEGTTEYFVFFGADQRAYLMMILVNGDSGKAAGNAADMVLAISATVKGTEASGAALQTPREIIGLNAEASPEWVKTIAEQQEAEQLFVVAVYENTTAWISLHEKDAAGEWKMIMSTPGFIGKNGLGKTKEGDGMSPVGVFSFNRAFGIAADPGCAIPYVRVDENTYWSGDVREGMRYNELVSLADYPDLNLADSEHIVDYTYQYQYCLNISYNAEGTPGLGSAIFLHCLGDRKPYTGGCVAIPMEQMYFVMRHVSPDCVVVIDTLENLGGSF